jgi:hypothetical protein
MLSRLAKSPIVKALTRQPLSAPPLARNLRERISTFWYKARVYIPGPAAVKPRSRCCAEASSKTSSGSNHKSNYRHECPFCKPYTIDESLCLALIGGGYVWAVDIFGRGYRRLKQGRREGREEVEMKNTWLG